MNILIVEDRKDLGPVLKALLFQADRMSGRNALAEVRVVEDLAGAVEHLAEADIVLCDGKFPLNDQTGPAENWSLVAYRASELGIPTVVYSADYQVVHKATVCGLKALSKPAPAGEVYAALMWAFDHRPAGSPMSEVRSPASETQDSGIEAAAGIDMLPEEVA